ncbi:MAG: hypothetical protein ACK5PP_16040 [Acidimicrobiales bacterium]
MWPTSLVTRMARVPWVGPRVLFRLHRRDLAFPTVTWSEFVDRVRASRPVEVSVDVFDTCLIRDLAADQAVELAIDHRWAGAGSAHGHRDVAADELERELCRPVPAAIAGLDAIRSLGSAITFVSDTDRSSALLVELLRSHGLFHDGDRLFASCEMGATKSRGDLYPRIWPDSPPEDTVWHVGNNPWADGVMAARHGIRPFHVAEADLNRYERLIAADARSTGPAIAAAARSTRLEIAGEAQRGEPDGHRAAAQTQGVDIAGQALVAFSLWLAEEAERAELTSLGFLARDGELPMRIAELLPADHWNGLSMSYVHCSRMLWGLASASAVGLDRWLAAGTADAGAFLETHRHDVPLAALLARIGLEPADLDRFGGAHAALAAAEPDEPLTPGAVADWHALLADESVGELVLERSDERRLLLIDYARHVDIVDGHVGLVDVGWRCRLAWHISSVLRSAGADEPTHFHFGGTGLIPDVEASVPIRRFAYQGSSALERSTPVARVETLTASGRPRVVDYFRDGSGEVEPIFDRPEGSNEGDRADLWEGALRMAARIPSRKALDGWGVEPVSLGPAVRRMLGQWWESPTVAEVEAIAGLRFEHDEAGTTFRPLVAAYTVGDVVTGTPRPRTWTQGSESVTPAPMRVAVKLARQAKLVMARFR